ncbi:MAG: ribbon-helix-helix protein, CopG family [Sphingomonadales bacterium]|nr:ribbon-helix-helix protein, CopG family [Sphingomonadales bacterium]
MARILADLPDDDIKRLDARTAEQGKSRSDILLDAIRWYLRRMEPAK